MGDLIPITKNEKFVPKKIRAELFYGIDSNLDEDAKAIYQLIISTSRWKTTDGARCMLWPTVEDAVIAVKNSEFGKDLTISKIHTAFTTLRRNRYIRHRYDSATGKRIMEVIDFIGVNAR